MKIPCLLVWKYNTLPDLEKITPLVRTEEQKAHVILVFLKKRCGKIQVSFLYFKIKIKRPILFVEK